MSENIVYRTPLHHPRYQYVPLNEGSQEIRLLTLSPGTFSSPLHLSLESKTFMKDLIPRFDALSYTWGSTEILVDVDVDIGNSCYTRLAITPNLSEALPYLRLEDRPRVLWIDAICVNQQDMIERGSQVIRMGDIYSRAERVVVWLGPQSQDSSLALDLMTRIASNVDVDWVLKRTGALSEETHWADLTSPFPFYEAQFRALFNFINRSWFERLWIWQEVRLATREVLVMCGSRSIAWRSIMNSVFCLQRKPAQPLPASYDAKKRADDVYQLCDAVRPVAFDSIIDQTKYTKCADPRDRIFALLSLLDAAGEDIGVIPDYTRDLPGVYHDAVLSYIQKSQSLQILTGIEVNSHSGLPSWVPDWSTRKTTSPLRNVLASGLSSAQFTVMGQGKLQVMGVCVGPMELVEVFDFEEFTETTYQRIIVYLRTIASKMGSHFFIPGNKYCTALCRAVCSNRFAERWYPSNSSIITTQQSEECLARMLELPIDSKAPFSAADITFLENVSRHCHHRALFLCNGQPALGPKHGKTGDVVAVLLGCNSTMVLRPKLDGNFEVIGEVYCAGVMDGEALLGSFPGAFRPVLRHNNRNGQSNWGYVEDSTGNSQVEDPRLGKLPKDWYKKSHEDEEYNDMFVRTTSGDETHFDPRLSTESLLQRGVRVQAFTLV